MTNNDRPDEPIIQAMTQAIRIHPLGARLVSSVATPYRESTSAELPGLTLKRARFWVNGTLGPNGRVTIDLTIQDTEPHDAIDSITLADNGDNFSPAERTFLQALFMRHQPR